MEEELIDFENITYDDSNNNSVNLKKKSLTKTEVYKGQKNTKDNRDENIYSKEEVNNILKGSIENMLIKLEKVINEKFQNRNIEVRYNKTIINWNEVLCDIKLNRNFLTLKLSNDFICDSENKISSIYITLLSNGKDIFTECIRRIKQEYEFISRSLAHIPVNETELYFKVCEENKIIDCVVSEVEKIIQKA